MQVIAEKIKSFADTGDQDLLHTTLLKQFFHCLKSFNVVFLLKAVTNTVDNYFICLIK